MCSCDYDPSDVWDANIQRARKQYHCDECGEDIHPGEHYERVGSLFDGRWSTYRFCLSCVEWSRALGAWSRLHRDACVCWTIGDMAGALKEVQEWVEYEARRAA